MNKLVAISIGDINGIGIELLIQLLKKEKLNNFVLFSNYQLFNNFIKKNNIKVKTNVVNGKLNRYYFRKNFLNIFTFNAKSDEENTIKSIKISHRECLKKNYIGLITLPLRKDLIIEKIFKKFIGHTEYLQELENKKFSNMILFHNKILISTITTHIKINDIVKTIKKKNYIMNKILSLNYSLKRDFNIKDPKILISGLNPHAGENGNIGTEEDKIIKPIVKKLYEKNVNIEGPFSADTLLISNNIKNYDCFLFIFHDQALIPFKYISNFSGVNYTGNLEIIRTSPDHGTAYNLKGKNIASINSLKNCFSLINKIYNNRIKYDKIKKISKSKFYN